MGMTASLWPADVSVVNAKQYTWGSCSVGMTPSLWPEDVSVLSSAQRPGLPRNAAVQG